MTVPRLPSFYRLTGLARVASTSDEAKRLAAAGAPEGTLIWALEQSAGRGRRGRAWISPPGNLYLSLLLRPRCAAAEAAQLGFVAAVAVGEACAGFLPLESPSPLLGEGSSLAISYKWPNDVLLGGRKVAGILPESQSRPDGALAWVVLGIGVNLVAHPEDTEFPATSLAAAGATRVPPEAMLEAVAAQLLAWYERWRRAEGFAAVRRAWLARAHGLGAELRARLPQQELRGRFAGLDEDGALLLEAADGRRRIAAAEIFPAA